jgi:hypothetical protein
MQVEETAACIRENTRYAHEEGWLGTDFFAAPHAASSIVNIIASRTLSLPQSAGLQGAEGWRGLLFLLSKKRDSPERTQAGAVTGLGEIYGMDCCW